MSFHDEARAQIICDPCWLSQLQQDLGCPRKFHLGVPGPLQKDSGSIVLEATQVCYLVRTLGKPCIRKMAFSGRTGKHESSRRVKLGWNYV
jgi:hypothetical protein